MRHSVTIRWFAVGLALVGVSAGCGKFLPARQARVAEVAEEAEPDLDDLETIAEAYKDFVEEHSEGPKDQQELFEYLEEEPTAQEALTTGRIVFHYGVTRERVPRGIAATVVAYEAKVPQEGGRVVMGDGEIRTVTAQEFKELPQPTPAKVN
jgi:hypothetical protein